MPDQVASVNPDEDQDRFERCQRAEDDFEAGQGEQACPKHHIDDAPDDSFFRGQDAGSDAVDEDQDEQNCEDVYAHRTLPFAASIYLPILG